MADPQIQGLPPGLTPVAPAPSSGVQGLPPGLTPVPQPPAPLRDTSNDVFGKAEDRGVLANTAIGFSKLANQTAVGAKNLANKVLPESMQIPALPIEDQNLHTQGWAQGTGGLIENAAEFLAGDEALKAVSEFTNVAKYAQNGAGWVKYLMQDPRALKAAEAIGRIARYTMLGGAQGGVQGAERGDALGGAERGAVGGLVGGTAGEAAAATVPSIVTAIAKKVGGIDRAPVEELIKSAKPGKWDTNFRRQLTEPEVLEKLHAEIKADPPENYNALADDAKEARDKFWTNDIKPLIKKHYGEEESTSRISTNLRAQASRPELVIHNPDGAENYIKAAQKWDTINRLPVEQLETHLEQLNNNLNAQKWWDLDARKRLDETKVGTVRGVMAQEAQDLQELLYTHMTQNGTPEIQQKKLTYGALSHIENVLRGRANIVDTYVPMSLKEIIGLSAAAAAGPKGWVAAAVPYIDKAINNPTRSFVRGVENAVNPGQNLASKAVKAVAGAAKDASNPGAAFVGAETEEPHQ